MVYKHVQRLLENLPRPCSTFAAPQTRSHRPTPQTLDPKPKTLDPKPQTLDPTPQTLDPKRQTLAHLRRHPAKVICVRRFRCGGPVPSWVVVGLRRPLTKVERVPQVLAVVHQLLGRLLLPGTCLERSLQVYSGSTIGLALAR